MFLLKLLAFAHARPATFCLAELDFDFRPFETIFKGVHQF